MQRFISRDPIGLKGGSNLYTYAKGNPQKYVDPFGLVWCIKGTQEHIGAYLDFLVALGVPLVDPSKLKEDAKCGEICLDLKSVDWSRLKGRKTFFQETVDKLLSNKDTKFNYRLVYHDPDIVLGGHNGSEQIIDLEDFGKLIQNVARGQAGGVPAEMILNLMTHELGEGIIAQTEGLDWNKAHRRAVDDYENVGLKEGGGKYLQRTDDLNHARYVDTKGNRYELNPYTFQLYAGWNEAK